MMPSHDDAPLVSICMPAFNVAATIRPALESVLAQTYPHLEIIVVDDASNDGTADAVRALGDTRIRYVRNERNLGGYQTMNRALQYARGEFVAVYHSDDLYAPQIVQEEVTYLQSHGRVGAVFALDHFIDDEGRVFGGARLPRELAGHDPLTYSLIFPALLRRKNVFFRCPTFMARRSVLDDIGPFDAERYDIAADLDMWIRVARRHPVGILNARLMYYRVGKGQWSTRYNYLRTEPELFFVIMDRYLEEDGWLARLDRATLSEYEFHRREDDAFRAANWLLRRRPDEAARLLRASYPWHALLRRPTRRKIRLALLRTAVRACLPLASAEGVRRVLHQVLYQRRQQPLRRLEASA